MNRVLCVMALTFCVAALVAVVSPVRADTLLMQENFEEPGAASPGAGASVTSACPGWTGSSAPYLSSNGYIDSGNYAQWVSGLGHAWVNITHAFSDTPGAGDTYTLTGTLYAPYIYPSVLQGNASLFLADSAAENYEVGITLNNSTGYFVSYTGPTKTNSLALPAWNYNDGLDVKMVITPSLDTFYYRDNNGTAPPWTLAGSFSTGLALSTYKVVTMDVDTGYAGGIDSINLTTSSVPEPSAIVLLATGVISLLAYAWRKRKS